MTAFFDITSAELNGQTLPIIIKNQRRKNHELENDIVDLGKLALGIKVPPNLQGEYDLILKLKIA